MPRQTQKAKTEAILESCLEFSIALHQRGMEEARYWNEEEGPEQEREEDDSLELMMNIAETLVLSTSQRYLLKGAWGSAGRHDDSILDNYIFAYPESAFQQLFRMQRKSFWQLVEYLEGAGGPTYWKQIAVGPGPRPRPVYQQIAVGLYRLGDGGGAIEQERMQLNIAHGSVQNYSWRLVVLLSKLHGVRRLCALRRAFH